MPLNRSLTLPALLLLAVASGCHGYRGGAPEQACGNLTPQHGPSPQPENQFPYQLDVMPTSVKPGDSVKLTIRPSDSDTPPIKGFFVQARDASPDASDALGQFVEIDDSMYQAVSCNGPVSGVTHRNSDAKQTVSVTWQAPDALDGDVVFLVTVVQERPTFWAGVKSEPITVLTDGMEPTAEPQPEQTPEPEPEPTAEDGDKRGGAGSVGASAALLLAPLAMATLLRLQ